MRIVDPDSKCELSECSVGEIWVSSDSTAVGYFNDAEKSKATFYNRCRYQDNTTSSRQYLRTGDSGFQFRRHLFIVGRIKDIIIIRGRNYAPQDIEQIVESVPGVRPGTAAAFALDESMLRLHDCNASGSEKVGIVAEVMQDLVPESNPGISLRGWRILSSLSDCIFFIICRVH